MEKAKRWKVGDKVTYKPKSECKGGDYKWGGSEQGGFVGEIKEYGSWQGSQDCWSIEVTCKEGVSTYTMLEKEFKEWDTEKVPERIRTLADKYLNMTVKSTEFPDRPAGKVVVISESSVGDLTLLVAHSEGWFGGHSGNREGVYLGELPSSSARNCWWYNPESIELVPDRILRSFSSRSFHVGDLIKVIHPGAGTGASDLGKVVTVVDYNPTGYGRDPGVRVSPPIGNTLSGSYNGYIGINTFELVSKYDEKSAGQSYKFKLGDKVKVTNYGSGLSSSDVGTEVKIVGYGSYFGGAGYIVDPPIGNTKDGKFNCTIGEDGLSLVEVEKTSIDSALEKIIEEYYGKRVVTKNLREKYTGKVIAIGHTQTSKLTDLDNLYFFVEMEDSNFKGHDGGNLRKVLKGVDKTTGKQGYYLKKSEITKISPEADSRPKFKFSLGTTVKIPRERSRLGATFSGVIRGRLSPREYFVEYNSNTQLGHDGLTSTYGYTDGGPASPGKSGFFELEEDLVECSALEYERLRHLRLGTYVRAGMDFGKVVARSKDGGILVDHIRPKGHYHYGSDVSLYEGSTLPKSGHQTGYWYDASDLIEVSSQEYDIEKIKYDAEQSFKSSPTFTGESITLTGDSLSGVTSDRISATAAAIGYLAGTAMPPTTGSVYWVHGGFDERPHKRKKITFEKKPSKTVRGLEMRTRTKMKLHE